MILSRSSSVKPSTACASPGLSTRRVLLAAATLRFSSTTSGLFPGMWSDSKGSSAWPRRWKPQAERSAAITPAKAAREERSNDHIDEPPGDHDDFLHRLAVREARHRVVREGELLELLASGCFRRTHMAAEFAVDLEDELDFVLHQRRLVHFRPRFAHHVRAGLECLPKRMTDVGCDRREHQHGCLQTFLADTARNHVPVDHLCQYVHEFHDGGDDGVVFVAPPVVVGHLGDRTVEFKAYCPERRRQLASRVSGDDPARYVLVHCAPKTP